MPASMRIHSKRRVLGHSAQHPCPASLHHVWLRGVVLLLLLLLCRGAKHKLPLRQRCAKAEVGRLRCVESWPCCGGRRAGTPSPASAAKRGPAKWGYYRLLLPRRRCRRLLSHRHLEAAGVGPQHLRHTQQEGSAALVSAQFWSQRSPGLSACHSWETDVACRATGQQLRLPGNHHDRLAAAATPAHSAAATSPLTCTSASCSRCASSLVIAICGRRSLTHLYASLHGHSTAGCKGARSGRRNLASAGWSKTQRLAIGVSRTCNLEHRSRRGCATNAHERRQLLRRMR